MKIGLVLITLLLLGLGLMNYSITSLEIIDWERVDPELRQIESDIYISEHVLEVLEIEHEYGKIPDFLNIRALFVFLVGLFFSVGCFVSVLHLIIDKLLFRKYYDQPNYKMAVKRGVVLGLLVLSIFIFAIYNLLTIITFITIILIFGAIELFSTEILIRDKIGNGQESTNINQDKRPGSKSD